MGIEPDQFSEREARARFEAALIVDIGGPDRIILWKPPCWRASCRQNVGRFVGRFDACAKAETIVDSTI
jgi:hypothetical protein